jgi:hypothetical protein
MDTKKLIQIAFVILVVWFISFDMEAMELGISFYVNNGWDVNYWWIFWHCSFWGVFSST